MIVLYRELPRRIVSTGEATIPVLPWITKEFRAEAGPPAYAVHDNVPVTFLERRKGFGAATMDRRKTYVDVMERVLGSSLLSDGPTDPNCLSAPKMTLGSTVSEIQVTMLGRIIALRHNARSLRR